MPDASIALTGSGFGLVVGLRCAPELADAVRAALPHWWTATGEPPSRWWDVPDPASVGIVVRELEHWVAEWAPDRVFVHAGAVLVDGQALLLPGPSCSGKSTLVAALVAAGAGYLSDEYAVLDADGRVHAYPRPLRLRPDVTGTAATGPVPSLQPGAHPVAMVADLAYHPGAAADWAGCSPATAALRLFANAVGAGHRPADVLAAVAAAAEPSVAVRGRRGPAAPAATVLLEAIRAITRSDVKSVLV